MKACEMIYLQDVLRGFAVSVYLPLLLLTSLCDGFAQTQPADSLHPVHDQPVVNKFEHISVKDGLSSNSVNCILQDKDGFLWFGTNEGLNKYDGYGFTVLQPDLDNPARSFKNSQISGLLEDRSNRLWAVTEGGGLHEVNKQTGLVTPHPIQAKNASRWNNQHSIYEDSEGILWLGTFGGLARYNPDRHQFTLYPSPQPDMPVKTVFEDRQDRFWVATLHGLYLFNRSTGKFTLVPVPWPTASQPTFISFYLDSQETLWLGTAGLGLLQLDMRHQPWKLTAYKPNGQINPYVYLNSIHRDAHGFIWVGTTNGLQRINPATNQVVTYHPNSTGPKGISSNNAQAVYHDRAGTLWVGTDNGIDRQSVNSKPFVTYQVTPNTNTVNLPENKVYAFLMDDWDRFWISNGARLYRADARTNHLERIPATYLGTTAQRENYIHSLLSNGLAGVWLGTWDALYRYDEATDNYTVYPSEVPAQFISRAPTGDIWLGGEGGIASFNPRTARYKYYMYGQSGASAFPDKYVNGLIVSRTGDVWVLLKKLGIYRLNPQTGRIIRYMAGPKGQLNSNEVQVIFEDEQGVIWIGTHQGGLNRFDPRTGLFSAITIRDGLPSNNIEGITTDAAGNIWLCTNKGLCRFDPRTKAIHSYGMSDGLSSNNFVENAAYRHKDRLFFGSLNGIVHFNPDSIRDDTRPFPVQITSFRVLNQLRPLTGKVVTLNHDENFLSFEFAALTYALADQNQYAYQLVGVDKNWVQNGNRRFANYTNLSPGDYTFRIKASNSDGVWNETGTSIRLIIQSPWWATWWAYGVYILLFSGLIFGIVRVYTNRIRQNQELELNKREAKQLKAVDELKTRFFSNITHEFRTPLSLIIAPVEKLLQSSGFDSSTRHALSMVQRNANQLLGLINQLLDLSKLEARQMAISLMRGDLSEFVSNLVESFRQAADQKGIVLLFTAEELQHEYLFDADKWTKILTNLLSNAMKFTGDGGRITVMLKLMPVSIDEDGSNIQISITDTGIGISSENLPHIFDRFYQVDDSRTRVYEGTGIGLALTKELIELIGGTIDVDSQPNVGTTFLLTVPVQPALADLDVPALILPEKSDPVFEPLPDSSAIVPADQVDVDSESPLILIVEDNSELRDFLSNELAVSYRILLAANGEDGWELVQEEFPDIVITDVMMPKMDGHELTRLIKNTPATEHIAVVMLTAKAAQNSRMEGLQEGVDEYLSKPFHVEELNLRLRNLVSYQQKLRDQYRRKLTQPDASATLEVPQDLLLRRIYDLLDKDIDNPLLGVDWLAEKLDMNRKALYRKTHSLIQLPPNELIRRYRLRKATDLLKAGHPVAETAYLVGFKSPAHFTTVFKELYHKTPTEFVSDGFSSV